MNDFPGNFIKPETEIPHAINWEMRHQISALSFPRRSRNGFSEIRFFPELQSFSTKYGFFFFLHVHSFCFNKRVPMKKAPQAERCAGFGLIYWLSTTSLLTLYWLFTDSLLTIYRLSTDSTDSLLAKLKLGLAPSLKKWLQVKLAYLKMVSGLLALKKSLIMPTSVIGNGNLKRYHSTLAKWCPPN